MICDFNKISNFRWGLVSIDILWDVTCLAWGHFSMTMGLWLDPFVEDWSVQEAGNRQIEQGSLPCKTLPSLLISDCGRKPFLLYPCHFHASQSDTYSTLTFMVNCIYKVTQCVYYTVVLGWVNTELKQIEWQTACSFWVHGNIWLPM